MLSYDYFEAIRNTNQWLGATAKAAASHPAISAFPNPSIDWVAAGEKSPKDPLKGWL